MISHEIIQSLNYHNLKVDQLKIRTYVSCIQAWIRLGMQDFVRWTRMQRRSRNDEKTACIQVRIYRTKNAAQHDAAAPELCPGPDTINAFQLVHLLHCGGCWTCPATLKPLAALLQVLTQVADLVLILQARELLSGNCSSGLVVKIVRSTITVNSSRKSHLGSIDIQRSESGFWFWVYTHANTIMWRLRHHFQDKCKGLGQDHVVWWLQTNLS